MKAYKNNAIKGASTGAVVAAIAVIAVGGAGFYAYKAGYLSLGGGKKAEAELQADIESLKGEGLKTKITNLAKSTSFNKYLPPEEVTKSNEEIDAFLKDSTIDFSYATLTTSNADDKATAELTDVKVTYQKAPINGYVITPKVTIGRLISDKNHYFFSSPGISDLYSVTEGNPPSKLGSISSVTSEGEIKLNEEGQIAYTKSKSTDIKVIEANGGTTLLSIGEISAEASNVIKDGQMDIFAKTAYKNIVPGDLAKMFIGNIEPISFDLDYAYKGEDFIAKVTKLMEAKKAEAIAANTATPAEPSTEAAPAEATPAATTTAESQSFNGDFKVNNLSLLIGDAGVISNAALTFKKENTAAIPFGDVTLKISQYQKLLDLTKKFIPTPQEQVNTAVAFLSEVGEHSNGNFTFNVKLDGTPNILIGGKTLEQVAALREKYYPAKAIEETQTPAQAE